MKKADFIKKGIMAEYKQNDKVTDSNGQVWRRTKGGHWRSESTQKLYSGKGTPGSSPATPGDQPVSTLPVDPNLSLKKPGDVINTQFDIAKQGQQQGNLLTNPNQYSAFGSQQTTIDPVTGQPTVTQNLSQPNQAAIAGIQGSGVAASNTLQNILGGQGGGSPFGALGGAPGGQLSGYSQSIFDQLTKGLGEQKNQEGEQLGQSLANRGIPVGSELYNQQMKQFQDRYDTQFQTARNQAVTGGINATTQALAPLAAVGNAGYIAPQFQGFTPVNYGQVDTGQLFNTLQNTEQQKIAANASKSNAQTAANASKNNQSNPSPFG